MQANAGANGSVSPSDAISVNPGAAATFTATPKAGYTVDKWQVNGADAQTGGTSYTLSNVSANANVTVSFKAVPAKQYTITVTKNAGGQVSPDGAVTVTEGAAQTFAIKADNGYKIADVKLDGKSLGNAASQTLSDIRKDAKLDVTFEKLPVVVTEYAVSAKAGNGGTVSPSGMRNVKAGDTQSYAIQANEGYAIDALVIDGKTDASYSGKTATAYVFTNVTAKHTLSVTFKKLAVEPVEKPAPEEFELTKRFEGLLADATISGDTGTHILTIKGLAVYDSEGDMVREVLSGFVLPAAVSDKADYNRIADVGEEVYGYAKKTSTVLIDPAKGETREVTARALNLRPVPSTNSAVIRNLYKGEQVTVLAGEFGWSLVVTQDGAAGYVSTSFLK